MRTYLKIINPIVAVIVFMLCVHASVFNDGKFNPGAVLGGSIPTYFLAKGLFCSSTLFILGQVLLRLIDKSEKP